MTKRILPENRKQMFHANEWSVCGGVASTTLYLRDGRSFTVLIDTDDLPLVSEYRWVVRRGYASGRRSSTRKSKYVSMHRLILNPPCNMEVDHINGNSLDNRRSNIRIVTHAENCANMFRRGRHALRGVSFFKAGGTKLKKPWAAQVTLAGKHIHLGFFATPQEAADAAGAFRIRHMPTSNEKRMTTTTG